MNNITNVKWNSGYKLGGQQKVIFWERVGERVGPPGHPLALKFKYLLNVLDTLTNILRNQIN